MEIHRMNIIPIYDEVLLAVSPNHRELVDAFQKKIITFTDNAGLKPHLMVRLNATHSGYINNNKFLYMPSKMRKSVISWTTPYPKPVLKHHETKTDAIGIIDQAAYFDQEPDPENINSPKGYIQLLANITDEDAIVKISDGRLNTVSVGGGSTECWCSICNQDLANDGICSHTKGKWYQKDEEEVEHSECFWLIGCVDYKEVSFVNKPADQHAAVVNMELSTSGSDGSITGLDFVVGSGDKQIILQDFIEENIQIDLSDTEEKDMSKTKKTVKPEESTEVKDEEIAPKETGENQPEEKSTEDNESSDESSTNDTTKPVADEEEKKDETSANQEPVAITVLAEKITMLQDDLATASKTIEAKDVRIFELEATQERLLKDNTELRAGSHEDKAKEVLRLKEEMNKPDVRHISEEEDEVKAEELRQAHLVELTKRSTQSLNDSLSDLRLEYEDVAKEQENKVLPTVTNPGVVKESDDATDSDAGKSTVDLSKMSRTERRAWFLRQEDK